MNEHVKRINRSGATFIGGARHCLVAIALIITGCHSSRHLAGNESRVREKPSYTPASYIETFKQLAIDEMHQYGIPASIVLAQAMLESANGNSDLARHANNHFGVKCTSGWSGRTYSKGKGKQKSCYRAYRSASESFNDHIQFLQKDRYASLFQYSSTNYKRWAHGFKKTGYAANPDYPSLIINLIEKYNLHEYDRM